jgi:hypothetical protein
MVLSDAGNRTYGLDPLGRTDVVSAEAMIGSFYQHKHNVFLRDDGITPDFGQYQQWPCVGIELV